MNDNTIPILHYFVQVANITPIWAYLLWKKEFLSKKKGIYVLLYSLFIIFNSLSLTNVAIDNGLSCIMLHVLQSGIKT